MVLSSAASWFTSLLAGEAVLLAGLVLLLLAVHSLPHCVVEVVVARLDHLGYQLEARCYGLEKAQVKF